MGVKKNINLLIIGIFIGILLAVSGAAALKYKDKIKAMAEKVDRKIENVRYLNTEKATEELILADFESADDFVKFQKSGVEASLTEDFHAHGASAVKLVFQPGEVASFKIEQFLKRDPSFFNWAAYGSFYFNIFNPQNTEERMILKVEDASGKEFKKTFSVPPGEEALIEVEIAGLRHILDVYNIRQVNLFLWQPKSAVTFYVDYLRLAPARPSIKQSIFAPEFQIPQGASPYAVDISFSAVGDRWKNGDHYTVPFVLINPTPTVLSDIPVRGGVPFPRGQVFSENEVQVKAGEGQAVPFQSRVMAKWPDGSIKWMLIDTTGTLQPSMGTSYRLEFPVQRAEKPSASMITETPDTIEVATGEVRFQVSKKEFCLFNKVWLGEKEVVSTGSDLTLRFRGDVYKSSLDRQYQLTIEENGPLVAGLKAEGWFVSKSGKKFCKFIVRIKAYKDESFVRVFHTFIYTGYPENSHHYLYKGKRLPDNEMIDDVSFSLQLPEAISERTVTSAEYPDLFTVPVSGEDEVRIFQSKDDYFDVEKAVGGQSENIREGKKLEGWVDVSGQDAGIAVSVRKLWQQFPKKFLINEKDNRLDISLWPLEAGPLDLKTTAAALGPEAVGRGSAFGFGKTHELLFYFHSGPFDSNVRDIAWMAQEPPLVAADPQWVSDTRALGVLSSYESSVRYYKRYEDMLAALSGWGIRQKERYRWYGMVDFGDTLSWHRKEEGGGEDSPEDWYPTGRWGWFNVEGVGTHMGALLQFVRTHQYPYFQFAEDLSRHAMDVDTCHYNTIANDPRLKELPDDYSQPGSMHRHNGDHWGGRNDETSHTNLNGILLYYYLTGYDRALDVAKEAGEFFKSRRVTYFGHPELAPARSLANALWGEIALYEATQDEQLLKEANYWAELLFQGQNTNGSINQTYDPTSGQWSGDPHLAFMSDYILPAFIEYHQFAHNVAIGQAIVKMTGYLMKNDIYLPIFNGLSYSYYLTGDIEFLKEAETRLERMRNSQRDLNDPLWYGMIYQKLYYARLANIVTFTPYAFGAFEVYKMNQAGIKE